MTRRLRLPDICMVYRVVGAAAPPSRARMNGLVRLSMAGQFSEGLGRQTVVGDVARHKAS